MGNYYSVYPGTGTATADSGRTTSAPTGAFTAANSYGSVYDVFAGGVPTTAPVSGDIILMAKATETYAGNRIYGVSDGITIISTKVTDREVYEAGAVLETTAGGNLQVLKDTTSNQKAVLLGVNLECNDVLNHCSSNNNHLTVNDCAVKVTTNSTSDQYNLYYDGSSATFNSVDFSCASTSPSGGMFRVSNGTKLTINGGSLNASTLLYGSEWTGDGGCTIEINNFDLSLHLSTPIVPDVNQSADRVDITFTRCKMPASFDLADTITSCPVYFVDAYSCDNGDGYHYFKYVRYEGIVKEELSVYLTAGDVVEGTTTHFSAEYQPNSNVIEFSKPLSPRPLKVVPADIKAGAKTFTFEILLQRSGSAPTPLTHGNCRLKAVSPNGTYLALGITTVSLDGSTEIDALSASGANDLDTSSLSASDWTNESGTIKLQTIAVTVTQNNNTGMDKALIEFWLEVSTDLDGGETEMFVDTLPTVT